MLTVEIASDTEALQALKDKLRSLDHGNVLRLNTEKGVLEIDFDALFTELDQELNG